MNNDLNNNKLQEEDRSILDIKKEISYYLFFWPWFLLAILVSLTATYFNLRYEDRVYQTTGQIQIKKKNSDASSFLTAGADGFFNLDKVNVQNDIDIMTSQHILSQVVERLNLQTKIYTYGKIVGSINSKLQFNNQLPLIIEFKRNPNRLELEFEIEDGKLTVYKDEKSYTLIKGEVFEQDYFVIRPIDSLLLTNTNFKLIRTSLNAAVSELKQNLNVTPASKLGEIINIAYKGTNTKRNEAILNTLINVLEEDQVLDKRKISKVSMDFIDNRLKGLTESIDSISENTIIYQMDNDIYEPYIQTKNALENIIKGQEESFSLEIQLEIANTLLKKLEAQSDFDILPANIGVENQNVNSLVSSYNTVVIQRNNLLMSASEQSPMVQQLTMQLENSRAAIITGVNRYIKSLEVSLSRYQVMESNTKDQVAKLPTKENTLRSYARNFKLVEELYIFLLKRKEEASISYISALPNLKVLSYAVSNNSPISPDVFFSYIIAIAFGLFGPFCVLFVIKFLDTKINTRDDLENGLQGISILGEVPLDENLKEGQNDVRGITAESTRVLRSSLSFLLKKENGNVIVVTSTIKGEGKSFVSYNLASSYKALGKKVILVGADLRNPQLHNILGIERDSIGLSTFLTSENVPNLDTLITKGSNPNEMDYLLSGAIPPNPSELLMRPRMKELLEILKVSYDVVLLDTAPLLLVSDTMPLLLLSDLVVYVTRAQHSDKTIFPFIKELQNQPNIPPFGMVLNGLIAGPQSGYNYKYGYRYSYRYRYSYSYKYNYGYGYGYGADKNS